MATTTRKPKTGRRNTAKTPLPASAGTATIGGMEYILIPSGEFEEWYADQMLAAIAADRLETERERAIPWDEVVARLRKNRSAKTGRK